MASANDVLNIARGELGYSRWDDSQAGTKYGRWYADLVGDSYYGSNGVPYCAMFASWVFSNAGQSMAGLPGAYCPWIVNAIRNAGCSVSASSAQPGDIVLFDWGGDGESDHIGIVESNNGSYLTCIEGNTNNGCVARRTRAYSTVCCVGRPSWGESSGSGSSSGGSPSGTLLRRGDSGAAVKALQEKLLDAGYGCGGYGADGIFGAGTEQSVIAFQKEHGLEADGIAGPLTMAALNGASTQEAATASDFPLESGHWFGTPKNDDRNHSGYYAAWERPYIKQIQYCAGCSQDGYYGSGTESAVKDFQANHGLTVDGEVGIKTWTAM